MVAKQSMTKAFWFAVGALACLPAYANPQGATVVHGSARFANPDANTLEVTNSNNAIINWRSFSIGQGETTRFVQPASNSAVLNRVTGADPSSIYGQLSSNGRVFLINQNGILVGDSGVINTAGFVGSTLDISNGDFLDERMNFIGEDAGSILNRGFISAGAGGEIVLVAPEIENRGAITAENGKILLAAGEKVTLGSAELDGISFEVQAPENSVLNLGELIAERGSVGVFAGSIRHEGVIEANSIGTDAAGNVVLRAQSDIDIGADAVVRANGGDGGSITVQSEAGDTVVRGTVEATGTNGTGGDIEILGERVGLFGDAYVDVSGTQGGGEVLVGGDYQGRGDTQTARQTQTGADSRIHADALDKGDGGRVIVWADGFTEAHGRISARGGVYGGDGGFVEVSGKENLSFTGFADVRSPLGNNGTVLFDPKNITIGTGVAYDGSANDEFLENPGSDITFDGASIGSQLTGGSVVLQANNDIIFQGGIPVIGNTANNSLTLMAGRSISALSGPFTVQTDGGAFTAIANATLDDGVVTAERETGPANIELLSGNGFSIDTGGGDLLLEIRDGAGRTGTQATAGIIDIGLGDGIQSGGGNITLRADNGVTAGGGISAGSTGAVFIEPYSADATIDIGAAAGGDQLVDGNVLGAITADRVTVGSANAGDVFVEGAIDASVVNQLTLKTGGNIEFNSGAQTPIVSSGAVVLDAGSGSVIDNTSGAPDVAANQVDILTARGAALETDVSGLSYSNSASGDVEVRNIGGGTLTLLSGTNSGGGSTTVHHDYQGTGTGDFVVDGDVSQGGGNLTYEVSGSGTSGTLRVNSANVDLGGKGTFRVSSGFDFNNAGNISSAGDIVIEADDVTLNAGSSIDAGPNARTLFKSISTEANWNLGIAGAILDNTELNTVFNNIEIGDSTAEPVDLTFANVTIDGPISFANNQNISIRTVETGGVDFAQPSGTGIAGAGAVRLITGSVTSSSTAVTDISADRLRIEASNGVGTADSSLQTQLGTVDVASTGTDGVYIANTGAVQIRRIDSAGGQIDFQNSGGDITILPTGVQNHGTTAADTVNLNAAGADLMVGGAEVSTDGGAVMLQADNDIQLIGGDQANRIATVTAANGAADITLSAGNNILLQGGSADNNHAELRGAGVDLAAGSGNIRLLGGAATGAEARVEATGSFSAFAGGNILLQGGTGNRSQVSINSPNVNVNATGDLSLLGGGASEAGARLEGATLSLSADNLRLRGGAGAYSTAGIDAIDAIQMQVGNDLTLQGGSGRAAIAVIGDAGEGQPVMMRFDIGRNLSLAGGSGSDALAAIGSKDGPVDIEIGVNSDFQPVPVGGNITLTAGSGAVGADENLGAIAGIGTFGAGNDADITIRGSRSLTMASDAASGNGTFIGANAAGGAVNIDVGQGATGGNLNLNGGRVVSQDTVSLRARSGSAANGDIVLDGGLLDVAGLTAAADGRFYLRGGMVNVTNADIAGRYTQSGGATVLRNGTFSVSEQYDLLGGSLMGSGTIAAPLLNNVGGVIAPGTNLGPASPDGTAGVLTIDGDLAMGAGGTLSLDLMGADNDEGRQIGALYDGLRVNGNAQLGGELELVVNVARYRGAPGDRYRPFEFAGMEGRFDSVGSSPFGYIFARRIADDGTINVIMTSTPFDSSGTFITEDEIQTLNRDLGEQLEKMIRIQRKRAFMGELPDKEEERKKRRAMICS